MYIDKLENKITEEMYERVYNKLKKCPLCRDSITDMIPKVIDD